MLANRVGEGKGNTYPSRSHAARPSNPAIVILQANPPSANPSNNQGHKVCVTQIEQIHYCLPYSTSPLWFGWISAVISRFLWSSSSPLPPPLELGFHVGLGESMREWGKVGNGFGQLGYGQERLALVSFSIGAK